MMKILSGKNRATRRNPLRYLVAPILAVALVGCSNTAAPDPGDQTSEPAPAGDSIVIGAAVALSGPFVSYDEPPLKALELYIDEVNAAGGIDGRQLELVTADTKSDPAQGPVAAQQVLSEGADVVVVSCDFDLGAPAASTAISAGKLTFSTCAGTALFGPAALGDLAFTAGTPTEIEAAAMAEWAFEEKGMKNIAMLTDDTLAFNTVYAAAFEAAWTELGGTIGENLTFKAVDTSVADQVARIASAPDIDGVVAVIQVTSASVVQQLRAGGITQPILAMSGMSGTDWLTTVPELGEFYFTDVIALGGDDPRPAVNDAVEAYTAANGPAPAGVAFTGYILGELLGAGFAGAADLEGSTLSEWFINNSVETIVGPIEFTAQDHIDRTRSQVIFQHQPGNTPDVVTVITPKFVPAAAN